MQVIYIACKFSSNLKQDFGKTSWISINIEEKKLMKLNISSRIRRMIKIRDTNMIRSK